MHLIAGKPAGPPEGLHTRISVKAQDLLKRVYEDVDPSRLFDYHTHIAGLGAGGTGATVNARMLSWKHPLHRLKFEIYLRAYGADPDNPDSSMVQRLLQLVQHSPSPGKHCLLAFDQNYHPDGTVNVEKTEFYVPNEYVLGIANAHPDKFHAVISVHPYREDALEQLAKGAAAGARIVKWLPNAMGIDPSSEKCDRYYHKMKELGLILLSHGGEEKAVESEEDQKLGNPLLLRKPLEIGVKVIVAHCAGLGTNQDIDHPDRPVRTNFELLMRLMDEKKYQELLFADISAVTQFNRMGQTLPGLLSREDLHPRIINGSDYPLPAINLLIWTKALARKGYIEKDQAPLLNQIFRFNPLVFDFALKRLLQHPEKRTRLPLRAFYAHASL